jgi:hypothetical protein
VLRLCVFGMIDRAFFCFALPLQHGRKASYDGIVGMDKSGGLVACLPAELNRSKDLEHHMDNFLDAPMCQSANNIDRYHHTRYK